MLLTNEPAFEDQEPEHTKVIWFMRVRPRPCLHSGDTSSIYRRQDLAYTPVSLLSSFILRERIDHFLSFFGSDQLCEGILTNLMSLPCQNAK